MIRGIIIITQLYHPSSLHNSIS